MADRSLDKLLKWFDGDAGRWTVPMPTVFQPPRPRPPVSERCRKCGGMHAGVDYDNTADLLRYECTTCGFVWNKQPLDKRA